jgi:predicted metal-dependent enzyme (double-stranded beta helix superfamily)
MSSMVSDPAETGRAIRACATAVIDAVARFGNDTHAITAAIDAPFQALLARSDLLTIGVPRPGNHVAMSWYLYYDGDLSLLIYPLAKGKVIPAHDHGNWESMFVYRGAVKHTVYERIDDGTVAGHADLRIVDDRVLKPGDSAVIAPPADIHTFLATEEDTYAITVASGFYKEERCYFQPEAKTFFVKNPKAA